MSLQPQPRPQPTRLPDAASGPACFDAAALETFSAAYPDKFVSFGHQLADHPLLTLDALATLGEELGEHRIEYVRSDVAIGTLPDDVPHNGLSIGATIRTIADNKSWAVLRNIEDVPEYAELLRDLLAEMRAVVLPRTGEMLTLQGFIFVSSPGSVTPLHFDPEYNILLQLMGSKVMHAFPAGDTRFAAQIEHERYHMGGHRGVLWDDSFAGLGYDAPLDPGQAVFMPVMAPHYVTVGPDPSISLSITWRSEWSYREAEAHVANAWLRRRGFSPSMPPRWPRHAVLRSLGWRAARKLGLVA